MMNVALHLRDVTQFFGLGGYPQKLWITLCVKQVSSFARLMF